MIVVEPLQGTSPKSGVMEQVLALVLDHVRVVLSPTLRTVGLAVIAPFGGIWYSLMAREAVPRSLVALTVYVMGRLSGVTIMELLAASSPTP